MLGALSHCHSLREFRLSHDLDSDSSSILAAVLPSLLHLRSLSLHAYSPASVMPAELLRRIEESTALTSLELGAPPLTLPNLRALTRLQRLEKLELRGFEPVYAGAFPAQACQWPAPSAFPHLRSFDLQAEGPAGFLLQVRGRGVMLAGLVACNYDAVLLGHKMVAHWAKQWPSAGCMPMQEARGGMKRCHFDWKMRSDRDDKESCGRLFLAPVGRELHVWAAQQAMDALTGSLPCPVLSIWFEGSSQLVPALAACNQLQAITSLRLSCTGEDSVSLQGHMLPTLRVLRVDNYGPGLSLVSAHLPSLERLLFRGRVGSLSIERSELPLLATISVENCDAAPSSANPDCVSVTISASALPALEHLSVCCKHLRISGVQLASLKSLQLTAAREIPYSEDVVGTVDLSGAALPALQTLSARGCIVRVAGAALPSLHTLKLLGLSSVSIVECVGAAPPALSTVLLDAGVICEGPAANPVAILEWLAGLSTLRSITLVHCSLPTEMLGGPRLASE